MKFQVLVLNADYLPHRVVDWKTAMVMIYSKGEQAARMIASYDKTIKDGSGRRYNLPAVVVLNQYVPSANKPCSYSKKAIIIRDGYKCQYCGGKFNKQDLTIDHVIPKAKAKRLPSTIKLNSFDNCVAACFNCNTKKADRTPAEAKMKLLRNPKPITKSQKIWLDIIGRNVPSEWKPYLESAPHDQV